MVSKAVKQITLVVLIFLTSCLLLLYQSCVTSTCTARVSPYALMQLGTVQDSQSSVGHRNYIIVNGMEPDGVETATASTERTVDMYSHCNDSLCSEYLSSSDRSDFNNCYNSLHNGSVMSHMQEPICHFMNGTGRQPVALVSFPGSGNTWVRGLLQKATGICTGAIYCDRSLRASFPGEGVRGGSVLVVKTHSDCSDDTFGNYGAAIFIMRDIRDAMISNWNRRRARDGLNKHIGSAGENYFYDNENWGEFLMPPPNAKQQLDNAFRWQSMAITWSEYAQTHPLLVVYYEDLEADTVSEVQRMVEFLGMPSSLQDLAERLKEDFSKYHRTKDQDFEHYTPVQKKFLSDLVVQTQRKLVEEGYQENFQLERYMANR